MGPSMQLLGIGNDGHGNPVGRDPHPSPQLARMSSTHFCPNIATHDPSSLLPASFVDCGRLPKTDRHKVQLALSALSEPPGCVTRAAGGLSLIAAAVTKPLS